MDDITLIMFFTFLAGMFFLHYNYSGTNEIHERVKLNRRTDIITFKKLKNYNDIKGFTFNTIKKYSHNINLPSYEFFEYQTILENAGEPYNLSPQDLAYTIRIISLLTLILTFIFTTQVLENVWIGIILSGIGWQLGKFLTFKQLQDIVKNRCLEAKKDLILALDLIGICSGAGVSPIETIRTTVEGEKGLLYDELRLVLQNIDNGMTFETALMKLTKRLPLPEIKKMHQIFLHCIKSGSPIQDSLLNLSHDLREVNKTKISEKTAKANSRIILPIIIFLLPCLILLLFGPMLFEAAKDMGFSL